MLAFNVCGVGRYAFFFSFIVYNVVSRRQVAGPGDTVLDCTAGNGHDSLELAKTIALKDGVGSLYIMDIQASALNSCQRNGHATGVWLLMGESRLVRVLRSDATKSRTVGRSSTYIRCGDFWAGSFVLGSRHHH